MPLKLLILMLAQALTLPIQPQSLQGRACLPSIGHACPLDKSPAHIFLGLVFFGKRVEGGEKSTTQRHPTHMTNDEYKDCLFPPNVDAIREFLFVFRIRIGSLERKKGSSSSSSLSREVGGRGGAGACHRWMRSIPFFSFYFMVCSAENGRLVKSEEEKPTERKEEERKE